MNSGFYGFSHIVGLLRGTNLKVLGKAGATAGAGLAGGTTSGAPTSGQFDVGEGVFGQDGSLWICTVAGSPGTFVQAGFANPLSTKADLLVGGAAGVASRLGVGSDAQVLTADSTQSLGLKWAASGSGSSTLAGDSDVSISSPSAGQLLEYNGTAWVNYTVPAVRCYNSSNQSISSGSETALTFNTNRFDLGTVTAQHSTSSNTSRLTCQQAGVYQITGNVEWASGGAADFIVLLKLNGTTQIARLRLNISTTSLNQIVTTLYQLAVNDYVELRVFQNSGAGVNVSASGNYSPEFGWVRVA